LSLARLRDVVNVQGSLWWDVYSEALSALEALNLPLMVWLNTITDPPFNTEKINFLRKNN